MLEILFLPHQLKFFFSFAKPGPFDLQNYKSASGLEIISSFYPVANLFQLRVTWLQLSKGTLPLDMDGSVQNKTLCTVV